ncbi:MAG: hypothetical protein ACE5IH_05905 [Thermodesulfobacteriota bacterium]
MPRIIQVYFKVVLSLFLVISLRLPLSAEEIDSSVSTKPKDLVKTKGGSKKCPADIEKGVKEALLLKQHFNESTITEMLINDCKYRFGSADLNADQMIRLREKFDEDFVKNWVGIPQFVTIGASAIYLADANKLVGAAILRILTPPRSYYSELNLFPWSRPQNNPDKRGFKRLWYNIDPDHSDAWINRWDLNFGFTSTSYIDNVGSDSGNFILAGLSYQLHRAAFLNAGVGFSTAGNFDDTVQGYLGLTVDSNILREVGLTR